MQGGKRIGLYLALGFSVHIVVSLAGTIAGAAAWDAPAKPEAVVVRGKALLLSEAVKELKLDVAVDPDPASKQVVVVDDASALTPLLSDVASRALFLDARLRGRPVELKARRFAGVPYVQVITFQVEEDGRFQTPEYYCIICSISVRHPQICPCCQGDMELRMKPERP